MSSSHRTPHRTGAARRLLFIGAFLPALTVLLLAGPVAAEEPEVLRRFVTLETGPPAVRDPFIPTQGFLAPQPRSARSLGSGEGHLALAVTVGNSWAMSGRVERLLEERTERSPVTQALLRELDDMRPDRGLHFADGELRRASLLGRFGVGREVEIFCELPILGSTGGFTDSVIESFHDWIGTEQSGRLGALRDAYVLYLSAPHVEEVFRHREPGTAVGDIAVGAKGELPVGGKRWTLALEGVAELPTGEVHSLQGSGSLDMGLGLLSSWWLDRSALHFNVGATWLGRHDALGLDAQLVWNASLAWEVGLTPASSLVLQASASASPLADLQLEDFDEVVGNVHLGLEIAPSPRWVLHLGLTENVVSLGNTVDVAVHLALTRRW